MSDEVEQHFAPIEIAALLKVDQKTVQGWLRDPNHPLTGVKMSMGWRVSKTNLKKFLEGNTQ